ncbi:hypothetical protein SAMN02745161_0823 [Halodesulfovibrio marinisediminis DSM 17456]|uniref:Uncharacterized protein n=1 Tax=Halodesulfovibrio marinisediminis DSM 17456 TaxID=1121457 RepID=A0A1N6E9W0_9BACT|nr:hypothetical protein SAMN02745161_0823 [Halodesulfovibrio marinisediminis DSM 17456]
MFSENFLHPIFFKLFYNDRYSIVADNRKQKLKGCLSSFANYPK